MPAKEILPSLSNLTLPKLAQIKPYWRVSMAALARRSRDLGKIDDNKYRSLVIELTQAGQRWEEDETIPVEEPTLLREIINVYLHDYGQSKEEVAKMMRAPIDDVIEYLSDSRLPRLVPTGTRKEKIKVPTKRGPTQLRLTESS